MCRSTQQKRFRNIFRLVCLFSLIFLIIFSCSNWRKPLPPSLVAIDTNQMPSITDEALRNCTSDTLAVSTCGCRGDQRGRHQNVIGFSLYGNLFDEEMQKRYVEAMVRVADQVRSAYPGWIVRIYLTAENNRIFKMIFRTDEHVDICLVESALDQSRPHLLKADQLFPMVWRFLPLLDPTVDFFMSRDADSYIFEREIVAVQEWLNSSAAFHVMRDNRMHCNTAVKLIAKEN